MTSFSLEKSPTLGSPNFHQLDSSAFLAFRPAVSKSSNSPLKSDRYYIYVNDIK